MNLERARAPPRAKASLCLAPRSLHHRLEIHTEFIIPMRPTSRLMLALGLVSNAHGGPCHMRAVVNQIPSQAAVDTATSTANSAASAASSASSAASTAASNASSALSAANATAAQQVKTGKALEMAPFLVVGDGTDKTSAALPIAAIANPIHDHTYWLSGAIEIINNASGAHLGTVTIEKLVLVYDENIENSAEEVTGGFVQVGDAQGNITLQSGAGAVFNDDTAHLPYVNVPEAGDDGNCSLLTLISRPETGFTIRVAPDFTWADKGDNKTVSA